MVVSTRPLEKFLVNPAQIGHFLEEKPRELSDLESILLRSILLWAFNVVDCQLSPLDRPERSLIDGRYKLTFQNRELLFAGSDRGRVEDIESLNDPVEYGYSLVAIVDMARENLVLSKAGLDSMVALCSGRFDVIITDRVLVDLGVGLIPNQGKAKEGENIVETELFLLENISLDVE